MPKLDLRKRLFAALYAGSCALNGTEAARRAGYRGSDNTLAVKAARLLKESGVRKLVEQKVERTEATEQECLNVLTAHLRGDLGDFLQIEGESVSLDLASAKAKGLTRLIHKYNGEKQSIELYDVQAAIGLYAKLQGYVKEKHEHTGPNGGPIPLLIADTGLVQTGKAKP